MDIKELVNFFEFSFFMHKLASYTIRTRDLEFIMKLYTFFRLILEMDRCTRHVHLLCPMCKLAFVPIATESSIRLNPIFTHLSLVLGPITLFVSVA